MKSAVLQTGPSVRYIVKVRQIGRFFDVLLPGCSQWQRFTMPGRCEDRADVLQKRIMFLRDVPAHWELDWS